MNPIQSPSNPADFKPQKNHPSDDTLHPIISLHIDILNQRPSFTKHLPMLPPITPTLPNLHQLRGLLHPEPPPLRHKNPPLPRFQLVPLASPPRLPPLPPQTSPSPYLAQQRRPPKSICLLRLDPPNPSSRSLHRLHRLLKPKPISLSYHLPLSSRQTPRTYTLQIPS